MRTASKNPLPGPPLRSRHSRIFEPPRPPRGTKADGELLIAQRSITGHWSLVTALPPHPSLSETYPLGPSSLLPPPSSFIPHPFHIAGGSPAAGHFLLRGQRESNQREGRPSSPHPSGIARRCSTRPGRLRSSRTSNGNDNYWGGHSSRESIYSHSSRSARPAPRTRTRAALSG